MLYQLGGPAALQEFGAGDARMLDPGSEAFERLIGNDPSSSSLTSWCNTSTEWSSSPAGDASIKLDGVLTTLTALSSAVINSPRRRWSSPSPKIRTSCWTKSGGTRRRRLPRRRAGTDRYAQPDQLAAGAGDASGSAVRRSRPAGYSAQGACSTAWTIRPGTTPPASTPP